MVTVNDPAVTLVGIKVIDVPLSPVMRTSDTHRQSLIRLVKAAPLRVNGVPVPAVMTRSAEPLIDGADGPEPLA
jgi:hypothetical protein